MAAISGNPKNGAGTPSRHSGASSVHSTAVAARQIAFTSTRSGSPQIYLMDADGSNVRRLTFDGNFHDEATWAEGGTRIACTTKVGARFQIATLDIVSGDQRVIAGPGNNESPCFSPDGSMLAFASDRTGTQQIFITDADGRRLWPSAPAGSIAMAYGFTLLAPYFELDPTSPACGQTGYLLYIKSSLTGNEPDYVRDYRQRNPTFPHETTADQFFSEAQFEAYRALGEHIGDDLFQPELIGRRDSISLTRWFDAMRRTLLAP